MEKGKGTLELRLAQVRRWTPVFPFLFSTFLLGACASPGEPVERKPPVPAAILDLSAEQSGNTVLLTFTLPEETADRRPLKQPPEIEIYRRFEASQAGASSPAPTETLSLLLTIPSALVSHYAEQGRIRYPLALRSEDFAGHTEEITSYMVRTRATPKKSSPDSNVVGVRLYPAAEPIADLKAEVAHGVVRLAWTPPEKTLIGPLPPIRTYRIYRAELSGSLAPAEPSSRAQPPAAAAGPAPKAKPPLRRIAETGSASYQDSQVEFGKSYLYAVRSVVEYSGEDVESNDSNLATITVRDTVPPGPPQGLLAVFVPAEGEAPAHLELSWVINPETDIAGYNVYRSERQGQLGTRLNQELLPAPAFRDMSTVAGHRYFYAVTAVDRSGNESPPCVAISGEVPAESQPEP
jgi:hypothetical protein